MKFMMQMTWTPGSNWDEQLPQVMQHEWKKLDTELKSLQEIRLQTPKAEGCKESIELHVFSEASEKNYAAALYAKIETEEGIQCILLAAKTRVAAVKLISIPLLELYAAFPAAQLMKSTLELISHTDFKISNVFGWSDSTIAFNWIADLPRRRNCFVGNHVAQI